MVCKCGNDEWKAGKCTKCQNPLVLPDKKPDPPAPSGGGSPADLDKTLRSMLSRGDDHEERLQKLEKPFGGKDGKKEDVKPSRFVEWLKNN